MVLGWISAKGSPLPDRDYMYIYHAPIDAQTAGTYIFLTASVRGISLWPTTRASCGETRITALRPDILSLV